MADNRTHRPAALTLLTLAAAGALGLTACGSTGAGATSTTKPSSGLGAAGNGSAAVRDASTLCGRTSTAIRDFQRLNLSSPSSASQAAGVLLKDVSQIQAALASASSTASTSGNADLKLMVSTAKAGISELNMAMTQFSAGNLTSARADVSTAVQDFRASRSAGTKINIRSCF